MRPSEMEITLYEHKYLVIIVQVSALKIYNNTKELVNRFPILVSVVQYTLRFYL